MARPKGFFGPLMKYGEFFDYVRTGLPFSVRWTMGDDH